MGEAASGGGLAWVGRGGGDREWGDPVGRSLERVSGVEGAGEIDESGEEGGPAGGVPVSPRFRSQGEPIAKGGRGPSGVEGAAGDFLDFRADMFDGLGLEIGNRGEIGDAEGTELEPFAAELMKRLSRRPAVKREEGLVQLGVQRGETGIGAVDLRAGISKDRGLCQAVEGGAELEIEIAAVALGIMDDPAEVAEAEGRQSVLDDVEGGTLVADEEDALPAGEVIPDDVGDGLALAGTGWAMDDEGR